MLVAEEAAEAAEAAAAATAGGTAAAGARESHGAGAAAFAVAAGVGEGGGEASTGGAASGGPAATAAAGPRGERADATGEAAAASAAAVAAALEHAEAQVQTWPVVQVKAMAGSPAKGTAAPEQGRAPAAAATTAAAVAAAAYNAGVGIVPTCASTQPDGWAARGALVPALRACVLLGRCCRGVHGGFWEALGDTARVLQVGAEHCTGRRSNGRDAPRQAASRAGLAVLVARLQAQQ